LRNELLNFFAKQTLACFLCEKSLATT